MISHLLKKLNYSNVMATLALFIALGGVSYAAVTLPKNSVGSKQIRKNAVTQSKLAKNAVSPARIKNGAVTKDKLAKNAVVNEKLAQDSVTSDKVKDNGLTGADIDESTLAQVPLSSTNLTLSCPSDTQAHAGVCFEKTARDAATFSSASRTCGQAGRRLPLLTELESFRQENGIALDNGNNDYEITANLDTPDGTMYQVIGIDDGGNRFNFAYNSAKRYRCIGLPTTGN